MSDPTTADASASGVPYATGPGSVARELVAAIDRIAALEEALARAEAERDRLAPLAPLVARLQAEAALRARGSTTLLFELYGARVEDHPAWRSYRTTLDFSAAWAAECTANGVAVAALARAEMGIATEGLAKQMCFNYPGSPPITGDCNDISAFPRSDAMPRQEWTPQELLVMRRAFIIAMERAIGSRTEAGVYIAGKPTVRGRVVMTLEQVPGFEVSHQVAGDDE